MPLVSVIFLVKETESINNFLNLKCGMTLVALTRNHGDVNIHQCLLGVVNRHATVDRWGPSC